MLQPTPGGRGVLLVRRGMLGLKGLGLSDLLRGRLAEQVGFAQGRAHPLPYGCRHAPFRRPEGLKIVQINNDRLVFTSSLDNNGCALHGPVLLPNRPQKKRPRRSILHLGTVAWGHAVFAAFAWPTRRCAEMCGQ